MLLKVAQTRVALETKRAITPMGLKGTILAQDEMEEDSPPAAAAETKSTSPSSLDQGVLRLEQSMALHQKTVQTYLNDASMLAFAVNQKQTELTSLEESELLSYCNLGERSLDEKQTRQRKEEHEERLLKENAKMKALISQVHAHYTDVDYNQIYFRFFFFFLQKLYICMFRDPSCSNI